MSKPPADVRPANADRFRELADREPDELTRQNKSGNYNG